jgi:hypothetical protein
MTRNPYAPGTPEADEWSAIAAAPSAHGPMPLLPPDDPEHLAALDEQQRILLELGVDAAAFRTDEPRSLSGAGVLYGPDCSQYQGLVDWPKVRASGCVIGGYKVSEGRTFEDPTHRHNRAGTKAAGLQPLAYHFLFYSDAYAADPSLWARQADWFVQNADPAAIHVLDVEAAATSGHHLGVREFVARYRQLLPNHGLGVYANRALWENRSRMPYTPAGLFDFVWHAGVGNGYYTTATGTIQQQWSAQSGLVNSFAAQGYPVTKLWQITDHAKVPGVGGSFCDGNAFTGTLTELNALVGQAGDDSMSAAEVQEIKDYIASQRDDFAKSFWAWKLTSGWNGQPESAAAMLARAEEFAIEAGYPYARPKGNDHADTPTHAMLLQGKLDRAVGQTDTLEASEAAQSAALAGLDPQALADAIAGKLGGGADAAVIRQAVHDALAEQLPNVHLAVDKPA